MKKSKFLLSIFSLFIIIGLVGCGDNDINKKEEKDEEEVVDTKVESSYVFTKDSGILVTVVNPVNEIVNINVKIKYYDANEEEIGEDSSTIVSVHNLAEVKTQFVDIPDNAESFVIESEYESSDVEVSYANILDVLTSDNGQNITVTINNYDTNAIESVLIGVVFYESNEIVAYDEYSASNIPAQGNQVFSATYPKDINGGIIYFDRAVIVVNNAYNSK